MCQLKMLMQLQSEIQRQRLSSLKREEAECVPEIQRQRLDLRDTVSDQPRAAAVPVRRVLERDEGEGVPLIDWDD